MNSRSDWSYYWPVLVIASYVEDLVAIGHAFSLLWQKHRIAYKCTSSKVTIFPREDAKLFARDGVFHALILEHGLNPFEFLGQAPL